MMAILADTYKYKIKQIDQSNLKQPHLDLWQDAQSEKNVLSKLSCVCFKAQQFNVCLYFI